MSIYYSKLESDALLHVRGPDAARFLQGQTTCDVNAVDPAHAGLGAYCTPQGRAICDFLLVQPAEAHYALRMRGSIREHAAAVFGKYIVFSRAELESEREDWQVWAVWGDGAMQGLQQVFPAAPNAELGCAAGEDFLLVQVDGDGEAFECYLAADSRWPEALAAEFSQADEAAWQQREIKAGHARIEPATVEMLVPQALNFDVSGHVSFSKGCYTGQEVVARLHYRGKSKRRSYPAVLAQGATAAPGDPVFGPDTARSIGNVINYVSNEDGGLLLVSVTTEAARQDLHLENPDGPVLALQPLPYPLPAD